MGVLPAEPREDAGLDIGGDRPCTDGDGAEHLNACKEHEAEVSVGVQIAVTREKLIELSVALPEETDAQCAVHCRDETDEDRLAVDENERGRRVVGEREAADVLKDVETVSLYNVFWKDIRIIRVCQGRNYHVRRAIINKG